MSDERRCLIVDDQPVVRLGVREVLEDRFEVEEVSDGDGALELLTSVGDFDVAIVNIRSADEGAAALPSTGTIRALLRAQPGLGIVAHDHRPERHVIAEAIGAGARAYVSKSSPPGHLSQAVEAAADSETFVDPAATPAEGDGPMLTPRQREILQLYADGESTASTARRLGLSAETIRTHTKATLSRLDAHDRAHAVAIALRNGLIE